MELESKLNEAEKELESGGMSPKTVFICFFIGNSSVYRRLRISMINDSISGIRL